MHGVKRFTPEKRAAMRRENEERAISYRARSAAAMERRRQKIYDSTSLEAVEKVVIENPDFATLWNFRREILLHMHSDADEQSKRNACQQEFALTQECLGVNPKSYPVWFHREWVVRWGECSWHLATELKLTSKLLALDDRNFHCWTYRRSIVRIAGVEAEAELHFTTSKIESNFSNYSAWHYRSKLLPQIHSESGALRGVLRCELELVRNAFYTAPEDSSAWFYHRWLLAQLASGPSATICPADFEDTVRDELRMTAELIELEPDCKWPLATASYLGRIAQHHGVSFVDEMTTTANVQLEDLQRVDPFRSRHYLDVSRSDASNTQTLPSGRWVRQSGGFYMPSR